MYGEFFVFHNCWTPLSPSRWTQQTMDELLEKGDKLYLEVSTESSNTYWSTDDIPLKADSKHIVMGSLFHGTFERNNLE